VVSRSELKMLVWERGAGATLACGTGTCALALASYLTGKSDKKVLVHLPGGDLEIEIEVIDGQYKIWMTGAADFVFSGNAQIGGDHSIKVSEIKQYEKSAFENTQFGFERDSEGHLLCDQLRVKDILA
jgi:hypothetical protein